MTTSGNLGIGTTSPGALVDVGLAGTTTGTLRLEGITSGYVQLQTAAAAGSWTMTLPSSGGTNGYYLQTNGSGVTTWAAATGANYSEMTGNSNAATVAANSTVYGPANGAFTMSATVPSATASNEISMVSRAATVQNLYYLASAANGSSKTNTITVYKNNASTALTCSVTNATTCNDTTHSFSVVAGDWLSVKIVTQAGSTAVVHTWSMELSY